MSVGTRSANARDSEMCYGLGIKNKEAMEVFWNVLKNNDPKIPIKTEAPRITEQVSSIEVL